MNAGNLSKDAQLTGRNKIMKLMGFKKAALITSFAVMLPLAAHAAPSITSLSSQSLSHGQSITVSGAGFGVKSPVAPLLWDPIDGVYSSISEGTTVPVGGSYPWGDLSGSALNQATFTLQDARGKFKAKYSNRTQLSNGGNSVVGHTNFPAVGSGKLYLSYWMNPSVDPNTNNPSSFKLMRLTNDGGWGDGAAVTFIWEPDKFYNYDFASGYHYEQWKTWNGNVAAWNRMEVVMDNSVSQKPKMSGYINNGLFISGVSGDGTGTAGGSTTGALSSSITGIYTLGADWSNASGTPARLDFGEIYVDNTLARVEICNASTKTTSNHCEIQIPQTIWNDGQLNINVNQGSFADNSTAYLFVVDASGNASAGKAISFGSSVASVPAPGGLTVAITAK
jgi:hypothetical protein